MASPNRGSTPSHQRAARDVSYDGPSTMSPWLLVAPFALIPFAVLGLVLTVIGLAWWLSVPIGLVVGVAFAAWLVLSAESVASSGLVTRTATERAEPSLFNMIDWICDANGYRRPELLIIDSDSCNSLVFAKTAGQPTLGLTSGWLESLSGVGLEGLLARELARANDDSLPTLTVAASVSRVLPGSLAAKMVQRLTGQHRAMLDDFAAVRSSRYPPGLADALECMHARSPLVPGASKAAAHLWAEHPVSGRSALAEHAPIDIRIAALREL